ncbi:MAG: LPS export ABC transporter periplasmic protein LptC [Acidobacteria bacterium]|nr:LPS export ABC transporter periplasmic protein LptC [Acidobacteriota bacterium]
MTRWQRRARLGLATFGIVFAIVVYARIGEREAVVPPARPARLDPRAILESAGAILQQFREARQDYVVEAERQLAYEDGSTKIVGVTIKVRGRAGRDFVVSGREAQAGPDQKELRITGDVRLTASDGFVMTAERASFDQESALLVAPGPISFQKGGMSGSGIGMAYDQANDILSLMEQAHVEVKNEEGNTVTDFTAGSATLARQDDLLALEGAVRALRGEQVIEADRGVARLTANEEAITFIELRGNARVVGGGAFDSLSARDIDLDYTDDGQVLERVRLTGSGAIALPGRDEEAGRQFLADVLDLSFAPDASVTRATGRRNVRVDLPAAPDAPARSITARDFDATGEPGKGLTSARFTENVEYREQPTGRGATAKIARSRAMRLTLAGDAVTTAAFTGSVRFEDQGLEASGAGAEYDPLGGTLHLSGSDAGGGPRVSDDRVTVEAETIDVTLQGRRMTASGNVKTTLRPRAAQDGKLPGLLEPGAAATVNAGTLDYQGADGKAIFSGRATLVQGMQAIRGNVMTLDQATGDLIASGASTSTLVFDADQAIGRAAEIRYDDSARRITYNSPVGPPGAPVLPASLSQLSGPTLGDLRANRIEVILGADGNRVERLEAHTTVTILVDTRTATGDGLTYYADEERYVMTGLPMAPVKIIESCRETTGRTVTFFRSADRVVVDGNEETRTQSTRGGPCPQ